MQDGEFELVERLVSALEEIAAQLHDIAERLESYPPKVEGQVEGQVP